MTGTPEIFPSVISPARARVRSPSSLKGSSLRGEPSSCGSARGVVAETQGVVVAELQGVAFPTGVIFFFLSRSFFLASPSSFSRMIGSWSAGSHRSQGLKSSRSEYPGRIVRLMARQASRTFNARLTSRSEIIKLFAMCGILSKHFPSLPKHRRIMRAKTLNSSGVNP